MKTSNQKRIPSKEKKEEKRKSFNDGVEAKIITSFFLGGKAMRGKATTGLQCL